MELAIKFIFIGLQEAELGLYNGYRIKIDTSGINAYVPGSGWVDILEESIADHGELNGLDDDDHSQYILNAGRVLDSHQIIELGSVTNNLYNKGIAFLEGDDGFGVAGSYGMRIYYHAIDNKGYFQTANGATIYNFMEVDRDSGVITFPKNADFSAGIDVTGNITITSGTVTLGGDINLNTHKLIGGSVSDYYIWAISSAYPTYGLYYNTGTPDYLEVHWNGSPTFQINMENGGTYIGQASEDSDPRLLLQFQTPRAWAFRKRGTSSASRLSLESDVDAKEFWIGYDDGVMWSSKNYVSSTQANCYFNAYRLLVNGTEVINASRNISNVGTIVTSSDITVGGRVKINGTTRADNYLYRQTVGSVSEPISSTYALCYDGYFYATKVYNAVYNDYADYWKRAPNVEKIPGMCYSLIKEKGLEITNKRADKACMGICSDTYGHAVGDIKKGIPISVGGFLLAYCDKEYDTGDLLVPNAKGILTLATKEEIIMQRCVAKYMYKETKKKTKGVWVKGRHWVKVL